VTLVGPGGIGKTRLAVAAARQIAVEDGALLVDLAEIGSPGDVPRAVAGTLGIKEGAGRTLTASIVTALRTRRALLVLDNCEHVVDGAAALAQAVAEGCPGAQVLATSREGLGLGHGHERLVPVPPLDPAGAGADLFSERAAVVAPTFDPRANRPTVEQICRRLDGVPLAIELAAAWTASLTPAELLDRLDDQLRLLVGGRRTAAARHRTLRATIAWSYDLLSPSEQVLLQRLSVLAGPFDRAAAEAVAGAAAGQGTPHRSAAAAVDTGDVLHALVQRSMVVAEAGRFGQRFRLLETMRQFAAERLAPTGDSGLVAGRHARWCIDRVTELHRLLTGPAEVEGVARLDELWPQPPGRPRRGRHHRGPPPHARAGPSRRRRGRLPEPERDRRLGRAPARHHPAGGPRAGRLRAGLGGATVQAQPRPPRPTSGSSTGTANQTTRWSGTPGPR